MRLVTAAQMRALEQVAVDAGATWPGLMERAGQGVAREATALLGDPSGRRVLVLVGPGNNGGDGLVAARHLRVSGAAVSLYIWRRRDDPERPDENWRRCRELDLPEVHADDDPGQTRLRALLARQDLVIDALLGAGRARPLAGELLAIVEAVNASGADVLAVDLPTGVDADSGAAPAAISARRTIATGLAKRGLWLFPGRGYAGELAVAEIGIPGDTLEEIMSETLSSDYARRLLPPRPADAHKGTFGKVLVVAGSIQYPGAAMLSCGGAARVGAGLVTLGAGRSVLAIAGRMPEITLLPLPEGDWGAVGPAALEELAKSLEGYAALLIGPGLGRGDATREFVRRLFGVEAPKGRARVGFLVSSPEAAATAPTAPPDLPPTVVDADGLNMLAELDGWSERLPAGRCVLTPHPGEMRRLLKADELPGDPADAATTAAKEWRQVVVLKGASTVVASPDGKTVVHAGGNPALATAGTGDVLAGAIAGLLAQGLEPYAAAALGVYLHAAAGARVRDDLGDAGALASDLLPELPRAIKALRQ